MEDEGKPFMDRENFGVIGIDWFQDMKGSGWLWPSNQNRDQWCNE